MGIAIGIGILAWFVTWGLILRSRQKGLLGRLWREPVLRCPVLIIESDDWGPGPDADAESLRRLSLILVRFRDFTGCSAVMTLGVVLAVPDRRKMAESRFRRYHRITLNDSRFTHVRRTMLDGVERGVFALQLHGMEHYWADSVLAAFDSNEDVRNWLQSTKPVVAEALPSPLQSRWIDAANLPSKPLPALAVETAAEEEITAYQEVFGTKPRVAVPPTFVWTDSVERAWYEGGISVVVTPGRRLDSRDTEGRPVVDSAAKVILNGERAPSGVTYMVRDDYFEPLFGHGPQRGIDALTKKTLLGRPTLLETHRFNFVDDPERAHNAYKALEQLLEGALTEFPRVRFMSTEKLADAIATGDPQLLVSHPGWRVLFYLRRIAGTPELLRWLKLSGLWFVLKGIMRFLDTLKIERSGPIN